MATPVSSFLRYLLPWVPGCPDPLAKQAIVDAAIRLCKDSEVWEEMQAPFAVVDGQHTYPVTPPAGASVTIVKELWGPALPLTPIKSSQLQIKLPNWQVATGSQPVWYMGTLDWSSIRVFPIPMNAGGMLLTPRVAYQPLPTATELPDFLMTSFKEAVLNGAKADLMLMEGKAWSNLEKASVHEGKFTNAVDEIRISVMHERVQGTVTAQPREFGF